MGLYNEGVAFKATPILSKRGTLHQVLVRIGATFSAPEPALSTTESKGMLLFTVFLNDWQ
jgi:hypothetical protein